MAELVFDDIAVVVEHIPQMHKMEAASYVRMAGCLLLAVSRKGGEKKMCEWMIGR